MRTYFDAVGSVELPPELKGRQKEIWKSKILIAKGLEAEQILWSLSIVEIEARREEMKSSLPAKITEAVVCC